MTRIAVDIAKNCALALPLARRLHERRRRRVIRGEYSETQYALDVCRYLTRDISPYHSLTGDLLEIGPGGNLGVAALLVKGGMNSATCIDVSPWETVDQGFYAEIGVTEVLDRVEYLHPMSIERTTFADESFDVIVSYACFEHFNDPAAATRAISRLLKPGGVTAHLVDLRDHRDFSRPLDFLRYPDWLWKLTVSRRPFHTNRWRKSDLIAAFNEAGLSVVEVIDKERVAVDPVQVARFQPRFAAKDLIDLAVTQVFVIAMKPC